MKKRDVLLCALSLLGGMFLFAQTPVDANRQRPEPNDRTQQCPTAETSHDRTWTHGRLVVSDEHRYLKHADGTPFFWLGDTAWLLPEKLTREEVLFYLDRCAAAEFNVIQIQTVNDVPTANVYGESSHPNGYDFSQVDATGRNGYWGHMDYIVREAEKRGICVGMVCIWGGLVKSGKMNLEQAEAYGRFLAERYKDAPNIVWIMGGDIAGNHAPEIWHKLARTIKSIDRNHLMTYHPFGRSTSALWFHDAEWLDFNMFQSGHRRYGQKKTPDEVYPVVGDFQEEDNWRYVEKSLSFKPLKPCIDGEPSYENIPEGLHDGSKGYWGAADVRRYAYWSVFAGSFGHTYGHNAVMQFRRPGDAAAYDAYQYWFEGVEDPGYHQMKYLKRLMLAFPFFERVPAQDALVCNDGVRYDRISATRGKDYLLAYTFTAAPICVDFRKITGTRKRVWWYLPENGRLEYVGEFPDGIHTFRYDISYRSGNDQVLIVVDAEKNYLSPEQTAIGEAQPLP